MAYRNTYFYRRNQLLDKYFNQNKYWTQKRYYSLQINSGTDKCVSVLKNI